MTYCIYFLFKGKKLIYIGQTCNLKRRLIEHNGKFDTYRKIDCQSKKEAMYYELRLIRYFKPKLNNFKELSELRTATASFKIDGDWLETFQGI